MYSLRIWPHILLVSADKLAPLDGNSNTMSPIIFRVGNLSSSNNCVLCFYMSNMEIQNYSKCHATFITTNMMITSFLEHSLSEDQNFQQIPHVTLKFSHVTTSLRSDHQNFNQNHTKTVTRAILNFKRSCLLHYVRTNKQTKNCYSTSRRSKITLHHWEGFTSPPVLELAAVQSDSEQVDTLNHILKKFNTFTIYWTIEVHLLSNKLNSVALKSSHVTSQEN